MWVFLDKGFYSAVVDAQDPEVLVVRTRAFGDAEYLVDWIKREHGVPAEVVVLERVTDYPWRVFVDRQIWGSFLVAASEEMDYGNYKTKVSQVNKDRAHVYGSVWATLLRIEDEDKPATRTPLQWLPIDDALDARSLHDLTTEEWDLMMSEVPGTDSEYAEDARLATVKRKRKAKNRRR